MTLASSDDDAGGERLGRRFPRIWKRDSAAPHPGRYEREIHGAAPDYVWLISSAGRPPHPRVANWTGDNYCCRSADSAERSQARHLRRRYPPCHRHAIAATARPGQPDFTMLIGPDATARLLEVGVIETDDQDYVITP